MTKCRNPECVNGRTPGVIPIGKGKTGQPLFGSDGSAKNLSMRWGWVNCLACSITDEQRRAGAAYKHFHRAPAEIAQRAQLATDRAPYVKQTKTESRLGAIKAAAGNGTSFPNVPLSLPPDNSKQLAELSAKIDKLLEQNSKLSEQNGKLVDQLGEMMIENRALRMQIDAQKNPGQNLSGDTLAGGGIKATDSTRTG